LKIDFKFFSDQLLKSELLRSATVLVSGSVIAQLLSILLRPILSRLYSPELFGIYGVYLSIVGIIIIFSSFKYDDAILLPKSEKESINLLGLSLILNLIINLTIFFLVVLLGKKLISFLGLPSNFPVPILYVIPLGAFLFSSYQSLNAWLIRKKRYYSVSLNKLIRRGSEGVSQLGFAALKAFNGLIYSDIIGQAASVTTVAIQTKRNGLNLKLVSLTKIRYVARKYSEFPKFNLIPSVMSTCSYLLPIIFINKFFSPEAAGFFDTSKLLLSIPLAFIASSLSSVVLQKVSEKFNNKTSFLGELKPVLMMVLLIAIVEIGIMVLFGERLFTVIFGDEWITSGTISRIMVWSFAFNFVVSSFTSIFVSMRKIKIYSIWQSLYFFSILLLLLFKHLPFPDFIRVYVLIDLVSYFVAALIMITIVYKYESNLVKI
jgi:O-antigen/teichoic acid export membrane protein